MGSAGGDQSPGARVWAMYLERGKFLSLSDLDWNTKELERMILKKVREKGKRREDDRGKASMLMGIREVTTW